MSFSCNIKKTRRFQQQTTRLHGLYRHTYIHMNILNGRFYNYNTDGQMNGFKVYFRVALLHEKKLTKYHPSEKLQRPKI